MHDSKRRRFLHLAAAASAAGLLPGGLSAALAGTSAPSNATGEAFSFDHLVSLAHDLAGKPHPVREPSPALSKALAGIDYDAYQKIRFNTEKALWEKREGVAPVALFHQHAGTPLPVRIDVVENGIARELRYDPTVFTYTGELQAGDLPDDAGWAGFRVLHADDHTRDWLAFMGASYFRTSGPMDQYGLSARGLAIDTALPGRHEEFPVFTRFWLEAESDGGIVIHALMESPSLTGAVRIDCAKPDKEAIVMDVSVRLFLRKEVRRLGIAPLTSMFWFSETNRFEASDWRPEVHDNDGLAVWTGAGERIWRPLDNPRHVRTSSFIDRNPRGFGLMQRDRNFANYEDDGVFYDRRPAVWIEPKGEWGEGSVQLVEIPTDDEIHDNIVAYWTTDKPVPAGSEPSFEYRLHWMKAPVFGDQPVGHVIATRLGRAGVPGQPRPEGGVKYAIDFAGGDLASFTSEQRVVRAVVEGSNARIDNPYAIRVVGTDYWRLIFDVYPDGDAPVDLRAFLRLGDRALTETWVFTQRPVRF
ncbi:MAG: glucan biosynthesis protein [Zoogloeaceae bacterium]|nr:glucan biosynthesis protein [Zoogloeaceae bacterium]